MPDELAKAIRAHFTAFDLDRRRGRGGAGAALARRAVATSASPPSREGIAPRPATTIERKKPLYIMLDGDIAQTLGAILREELLVESEILAIDGVVLWDFDYIDLGRIRMPSLHRAGHDQVAGVQRGPAPRPPAPAHPSSRAWASITITAMITSTTITTIITTMIIATITGMARSSPSRP